MEPYTELMFKKGFNTSSECAAKRTYVEVPPEKRRLSQMLPAKSQKQIKLRKHGYSLSKSCNVSKF